MGSVAVTIKRVLRMKGDAMARRIRHVIEGGSQLSHHLMEQEIMYFRRQREEAINNRRAPIADYRKASYWELEARQDFDKEARNEMKRRNSEF